MTNTGTGCTDGIHCAGDIVNSISGTIDIDNGSSVTVNGNTDIVRLSGTDTVTARPSHSAALRMAD